MDLDNGIADEEEIPENERQKGRKKSELESLPREREVKRRVLESSR